jgi:hypothetical protein
MQTSQSTMRTGCTTLPPVVWTPSQAAGCARHMLTQRCCRICRRQLDGLFIRARAVASRRCSPLAALHPDSARLACGRAIGSVAVTLQETKQPYFAACMQQAIVFHQE